MFSVSWTYEFCAAHRIPGHKGKCRHLHGHNYKATVVVASEQLDQLGMVTDFGTLKDHIGRWINRNWDHNAILQHDDRILQLIANEVEREPFSMQELPTAENLACLLWNIARDMSLQTTTQDNKVVYHVFGIVNITSVTIEEQEGKSATYTYIPPGDRRYGS